MTFLSTMLKFIGVAAAALFLHIGAAYVLPYPFAYVNILFAVLLLVLLVSETGAVVWMAFFALFIIELFASSAPFGAHLFAGTIAMLFSYWLYHYLFTNRSWYAGVALAAITLMIYRTLYIGIAWGNQIMLRGTEILWKKLAAAFAWELALTAGLVGLASLLLFHTKISARKGRRKVLSF